MTGDGQHEAAGGSSDQTPGGSPVDQATQAATADMVDEVCGKMGKLDARGNAAQDAEVRTSWCMFRLSCSASTVMLNGTTWTCCTTCITLFGGVGPCVSGS